MHRELLDGEAEGLLQLPTDRSLVEDSVFRPFVELYAKVHEVICILDFSISL